MNTRLIFTSLFIWGVTLIQFFKENKGQLELVVFRSYSLGPLMKYSHISFIQLIEILYSTRLRLVKYKFQFVEFRKYDYIPFVDQVNN